LVAVRAVTTASTVSRDQMTPAATAAVARLWTLHRPGYHARLTFDVALMRGYDDGERYEVRIRLNDEPAYTRVWESSEAALMDADEALEDVLNGGWLFAVDPLASRP